MSTRNADTETIEIREIGPRIEALVDRVHRGQSRVLLEKGGAPVAAVISTDDLRRLDRLDQERAERFKIIEEMGAAFKGVLHEEIEREAAKSLADVRAEMRAERVRAAGNR